MLGPDIVANSISARRKADEKGNLWQYHPRSDHHSKVACWGVVLDLLIACPLLRKHVEDGKVFFGINHQMRDFVHNKSKDLDLVICTPSSGQAIKKPRSLRSMVKQYGIVLTAQERSALEQVPDIQQAPVGSVLIAVEAKACMTAHQKALPRLHDELNSSHQIVHGASDQAIAVGVAMVNIAPKFLSPIPNLNMQAVGETWSPHDQPKAASAVVKMLYDLPRRSKVTDTGFDAFATIIIDCENDGSAVTIKNGPPAPAPLDGHHYATMVDRLAHTYATRFRDI